MVLSKSNEVVLTIDLEDWFHSLDVNPSNWGNYERRIQYGTNILLNFLAEKKATATFFVLGDVAVNNPDLIKRIDQAGHEIGSHGFDHRFVYEQSPEQFKTDIRKSVSYLSDLTGKKITAFRAPYFSITKKSYWALDIICEEGFLIDSSIFPVINHRYGIPQNKRLPYRLSNGMWEFPITTYHTFLGNIPFSGGAYFRFLPFTVTKYCALKLLKNTEPVMLYFHPWEFDKSQPKLNGISPFLKLRHYYGLEDNFEKFSKLISNMKIISLSSGIKSLCNEDG